MTNNTMNNDPERGNNMQRSPPTLLLLLSSNSGEEDNSKPSSSSSSTPTTVVSAATTTTATATATTAIHTTTTETTRSSNNNCTNNKVLWLCLPRFISASLFLLFVYSMTAQTNAEENLQGMWIVFYALQAVLAGLVLLQLLSHHCCGCGGCCRQLKLKLHMTVLLAISASLVLWSIVLVIVSARQVIKRNGDDDDDDDESGGGDMNFANEREEYMFEVFGALLGLISALFHGSIVVCNCRQQRE